MRSTSLGLALLLLVPFVLPALPAAHAGEGDVVTALYDVGPLLQPDRPPPVEVLGLPPSGVALRPIEDDNEEEPAAFLAGEDLVELILSSVLGDEDERTLVSLEGRQLLVRASDTDQARVAKLLADLWAEATRRIAVDGLRLRFDDEGRARLASEGLLDALRSGRVDRETRDALVGASSLSSAASTVARPGSRSTLGRVRATAYVRDYDVEIAQDSRVGNPLVDTVTTGWFVDATAHTLQGGATFLDVTAQTASLEEPVRRQPLEAEPFGTVDLPTCRVLRLSAAARVEPGESLVVTAAPGGDRGLLEVLVLTPAVRGDPTLRRDLRRYDVSALTAMPPRWQLTTAPLWVAGIFDAGTLNPPRFRRLEPADPVADEDDLVEAILSSLGDEVWEREGTWLVPRGRMLLAVNDAAVLEVIEHHVRDRERALADESLALRLLAVEGDAGDGGDRTEVLASATLSAPHGRTVVWQSGVERAYVADWEVEVAQEERSGDPVIGTVFGGLAFEARLDPAPVPDRFALTLALSWTDLDPRMETRRTNNECTGVLDIPRIARLDLRSDLVVRRGETQRIDGGTLEDGRRLVVELTLTR